MATQSDYIVKNAKMVLNHFHELVSKKCLISAHFGDRNTSFLTTIVELDPKKKLLQLDCGPSETVDNQLLAADKVLFRTEYNGIKVSFSAKNIQKIQAGGESVLSMPIPDSIFWMQRRQYYRVKIPFSHGGSYCQLNFKSEADDSQETVRFQLYDLSMTGVAFLNPDPKWAERLQPDCQFVDCSLHLNNGNHAVVAFVIKNNVKVRGGTLTPQDKIGCLFQGMPTNFETSIQRYMQEIELQQKNAG
ncbi:flagellar brake protein [Methylomonas sp. SURF-2]|uniref:Flagellar brake protein YcgR n=1 Tax=Methylomonas subterranea TaxID=2952225 RepID=A0ABT1TCB8_9GAMM|nr:flagellar brake protein [Methylomonas sp. SURF-2]MCQ8102918.1 flagellar brake protein [Methylomonas sp. SURF-2]